MRNITIETNEVQTVLPVLFKMNLHFNLDTEKGLFSFKSLESSINDLLALLENKRLKSKTFNYYLRDTSGILEQLVNNREDN